MAAAAARASAASAAAAAAPEDANASSANVNQGNAFPVRAGDRKRNRGQNKARSAEELGIHSTGAKSLCRSILPGSTFVCRFGPDKCRDSHDLTAFIADRAPDVGPLCPVFEARGWCAAGVACRWAGAHTDFSAGAKQRIRDGAEKEAEAAAGARGGAAALPGELNFLSFGTAQSLRKNTYTFRLAGYADGMPPPVADSGLHVWRKGKGSSIPVAKNAKAATEAAVIDAVTLAASAGLSQVVDAAASGISAGAATTASASSLVVDAATSGMSTGEATSSSLPLFGGGCASVEKKSLDFRGKIVVAPLTTVGNLPFRRVMKKMGADVTIGEMALASNIVAGSQSEWALLRRHVSEDFFGVQLAGCQPNVMARAAELIEAEGVAVDFVDINCGCPLDMICQKGMGAACMGKLGRLRECVLGMDRILTCPVTLKMRTGLEKDEDARFAHKIAGKVRLWNASRVDDPARVFSQLPVAALTIHGRTRQQRYSAYADWAYIERVAEAARVPSFDVSLSTFRDQGILGQCGTPPSAALLTALGVSPDSASARTLSMGGTGSSMDGNMQVRVSPPPLQVLGNGDVLSWTDWEEHLSSGVLSSCMIARGALMKPWLPREIKERRDWDISSRERLDILRDFVSAGLEHWGSDQDGVNHTRRFLLEWLSFLCRYVPVGLLEVLPAKMNDRPPAMYARDDLETLFLSPFADDWVKITEMLLGPVPEGFRFVPKHKSAGTSEATSRGPKASEEAEG